MYKLKEYVRGNNLIWWGVQMCKFVDHMNFTDNLLDLHKVLRSNFIYFFRHIVTSNEYNNLKFRSVN